MPINPCKNEICALLPLLSTPTLDLALTSDWQQQRGSSFEAAHKETLLSKSCAKSWQEINNKNAFSWLGGFGWLTTVSSNHQQCHVFLWLLFFSCGCSSNRFSFLLDWWILTMTVSPHFKPLQKSSKVESPLVVNEWSNVFFGGMKTFFGCFKNVSVTEHSSCFNSKHLSHGQEKVCLGWVQNMVVSF